MIIPKVATRQTTAWHKRRFEERPGAVHVNCIECGRDMWLPPCKTAIYRRCSIECSAVARERVREARKRNCETCGNIFAPRPIQISNGKGLFCSRACIPSDHLTTSENLAKAHAALRLLDASGHIRWHRGEANPKWKGGPKASARRQIESGKAAALVRKYRADHPERKREWRDKRLKRKGQRRLPWGTITRIAEAQRHRCAICRVSIRKKSHLDHIKALSKGGEHVPANLQLLCPTCNVRKAAKDPIEYMQSLGRLL